MADGEMSDRRGDVRDLSLGHRRGDVREALLLPFLQLQRLLGRCVVATLALLVVVVTVGAGETGEGVGVRGNEGWGEGARRRSEDMRMLEITLSDGRSRRDRKDRTKSKNSRRPREVNWLEKLEFVTEIWVRSRSTHFSLRQ